MPVNFKIFFVEYLEVGAGENPTPGYVHQDIRNLNDIEIVCDLKFIDQYVAKGCKKIKAAHVLEHFSPQDGKLILKKLHNLLVPNGVIEIDVPNLTWQAKALTFQEITPDEAVYYIFGEQDYLQNAHHNGYTEETLLRDLTEAGFSATVMDIGQVLVATGHKIEHGEQKT